MHLLRFLLRPFACSAAIALHAGTVVVTVSPAAATVNQGATKAYKATVTGSTNTAVTWSVTSGGGSISTSGSYKAPTTAGIYTITATSKADTTKKATAIVTVPMKVTVSPTSASLTQGAAKTFVPTVTGASNKAVNWTVSAGGGSISSAGVYTAPNTPGTYTVTATTQATPSASASATVIVTGISISISPTSDSVPVNGTRTFSATVTGSTNKAVTWTAASGTITSAGIYTAPEAVGSDTVTATSAADPTKSASSAVSVKIAIAIDPPSITMNQGYSQTFLATITGSENQDVAWSATSGTIDAFGNYTAPMVAGVQTITAASLEDPAVSMTAKVTVRPISVSISPSTLTAETGRTIYAGSGGNSADLNARVSGSIDTDVTWSIVSGPGSLIPNPNNGTQFQFLAPFTPGTTILKATSVADPTKSATATITTTQGTSPTIRSFSASPSRVAPGGSSQLSGDFGNGSGVVAPGGTAMTAGTPLLVTPSGSTHYTLTVTGDDASSDSRDLDVAVVGPGSLSALPAYPSPVITSTMGAPGSSLQLVVTRDGSIVGIGGRTAYQDQDLHLYRLDLVNKMWTPLGVIPGRGEVVRFNALALPDGNILILTELTVSYQNSTMYGEFTSAAYVVDPVSGTILRSADLSTRYNLAYCSSVSLLPDGQVMIAGGKMLPSGISYCYYGLSCDEPQNWITLIDPATLTLTNPAISLNHARANHAALMLQDGRILFVGGGSPVLETYDPALQSFSDVGTLNSPSASAVMLADGKVLCLGADIGQDAIFDPSDSSISYFPDASGDAGFDPVLLPNGLVLSNLSNADASLLDPATLNRMGTANASDSVYFGQVALPPILMPDGTVVGGDASQVRRFDTQSSLHISPAFVQDNAGDRTTLFTLSGLDGASVAWSASGGTITQDGVFSAPTIGTYHITATASDGRKAIATFVAFPKMRIAFDPIPPVTHANGKNWLQPGDSVQLTAAVRNFPDQAVVWGVPSGTTGISITPDGVVSALVPGKYQVVATPESAPEAQSSMTLMVWPADLAPPVFQSVSAAPLNIAATGGPISVNWQLDVWGPAGSAFDIGMSESGVSNSYKAFSSATGQYIISPISGLGNGAVVDRYLTLTASNPAGRATANFIVYEHGEYLRVIPNAVVLLPGQTQKFNFDLQYGPESPQATWQAVGGGSIDASGVYQAPLAVGRYNVQATSGDNPAIAALSQVTVADPHIAITPSSITLFPGQTAQFGYSLTGAVDTSVYWQSPGGTVDTLGNYRAPSLAGSDTVTVYGEGGLVSSTATITVKPVTVNLSPAAQTVPAGSTIQFSYSADYGDLNWTATAGTVSPLGVYTPPAAPGTYTVTATSSVNSSYFARATVTVVSPTITLTPSSLDLAQDASFQFSYSCSVGGVVWSASGGTISPDGNYIAPATPGTYTVTATSALDSTVSANSTVTVSLSANKQVIIAPVSRDVFPGATSVFTATVTGFSGSTVNWSVVEPGGGAISPSGVYSAPATAGTYTIRAASAQDPTVFSTARAIVSSVSVSPGPTSLLAPNFTRTFVADLAPGATGPVAWSIDEGSAGGSVSGAGIYTAPIVNGVFHVRATLPGGDSNTVEVDIGQIQDLFIGVPVQVTVPGSYRISADLIGANGKTLTTSGDFDLPSGMSTPELDFGAKDIHDFLGVDGPWTVGNVQLDYLDPSNGEILTADQRDSLGATQGWSLNQLQQPWATLTGSVAVSGVSDSNGGLLGIQADIGTQLRASGSYSAFALLMDAGGNEVACATASGLSLSAGPSTISLVFPGSQIKASGLNGPYTITGLVISGQESDAFQDVGTVTGFNASDF